MVSDSDLLVANNRIQYESLNPYSTGRWFLIMIVLINALFEGVLILILLEDGF